MLQRNTSYIASLRTYLRSLTPVLYFCLIISLAWHDSGFTSSVNATSAPTIVAGHLGDYSDLAVNQGTASRRLPALLASAPKLPSGSRLRLESQDDDLPPIQPCWTVAGDPFCLPSLRIDPIAWDSEKTPSFLLPSAYGLVPFANPPPFFLA